MGTKLVDTLNSYFNLSYQEVSSKEKKILRFFTFFDGESRAFYFKALLQFSWRRGSKDSRGQGFKGLFSKNFISAFDVFSLSAISFFLER